MAGNSGGDEVVASPDRAHTAVVTQKGVLRDNARQFSLWVFTNDNSRKPLDGIPLAEFVSKANRPGIAQLSWLSNETLAFLAEGPDSHPQVYTIDLQTRTPVQRTHSDLPITMFSAVTAGTLVYATDRPPAGPSDFSALRAHGFVVPLAIPVTDVIAGKWEGLLGPRPKSVLHLMQYGMETTVTLPDGDEYGSCQLDGPFAANNFVLAPSGNLGVISCQPTRPPARWAEYQEAQFRKSEATGAQYAWWVVLDMHTGEAWPLTGGARMNFDAIPVWTADSRSVILVDDLVPLEGLSDSERAMRLSQRYTAEVDVKTHFTTLITGQDKLALKGWDATSRTLTLQSEASSSVRNPVSMSYHKTRTGWIEIKPVSRVATQSHFEVQQGLNEPWKLIRVKPEGKAGVVVHEPNREFLTTRRLARETLFTWRSTSGAQLIAGLYWPLDFKEGVRYPLLIQTHGFDEAKFSPDGYSTTGYAAQPLAAAGIMVIQAEKCSRNCDTPQRNALSAGQKTLEDWESMIDRLDELGLIDRSKVGLQGYSGSCYHELYFLTHSSYPIAGMVCSDGIDGSYIQYMLFAPGYTGLERTFADYNGGAPFGPNLKTWQARAPGFNLDNIHTPVRLVCLTDGSSLLAEWEPYAGLVLQGKPAELFFIPEAVHNIERPWERIASQQGTVDWFRFWLQDYERTEPIGDAEETSQQLTGQYMRWRNLRELQQTDLAKLHPTPTAPRP